MKGVYLDRVHSFHGLLVHSKRATNKQETAGASMGKAASGALEVDLRVRRGQIGFPPAD